MSVELKLMGQTYEIVDAIEYITLADSFVKNKLGNGHGEAKLYVGNESERLLSFFENFHGCSCFFCKKDFDDFLADAEQEYRNPQQEYLKKDSMSEIFDRLKDRLDECEDEILRFEIYRVQVAPPRVYINSDSQYYDYMRAVGLPNISYLSVLKLKDQEGGLK